VPFRLDPDLYPNRAKIQFTTSARMPSDIYKACVATDVVSNTVYIQHAVCVAIARDLHIPLGILLDALPEPRGRMLNRFNGARKPLAGPANTIEDVR
jgi:hypothetical protein